MSLYYVFPTVGAVYGTRSPSLVVTMGGDWEVLSGAFVSGIVLGLMGKPWEPVVVGSSFKRIPSCSLAFILILV